MHPLSTTHLTILTTASKRWWEWFNKLERYGTPWEMLSGVLIGAITAEYAQSYLALNDEELPNIQPVHYPHSQG